MAASGGPGETAPRHTNRLAQEQSPYLLQHAHNPVDWYPWGPEALDAAKAQDKPIFVSVGYSTCHWCHVMERESFEDEEAAALLNQHFISIKVDREERPDVDRVYMTYVQALTGRGGWPMSVWLTPQLQPIMGATYLPPADRPGMPSFKTVLRRIANVWETKRDDLVAQASNTLEELKRIATPRDDDEGPTGERLPAKQLAEAPLNAAQELMDRYDRSLGGFGAAPKFPRPAEVNALLVAAQEARLSGDAAQSRELLGAALHTLKCYAAGGMYDHLGGGFHRYSVDAHLHVPHFEKMLYDNPQLVSTYLDAIAAEATAEATGLEAAASDAAAPAGPAGAPPTDAGAAGWDVTGGASDWGVFAVRGVLDYLRRDMTHPEGGIFSAEDADSLDPDGSKKEGAFYVWDYDEVVSVLRSQGLDPALFLEVYDVRRGGNCDRSPMSDPHDEFTGKNVLIQVKRATNSDAARAASLSPDAAESLLSRCRAVLHAARALRPRPSLDDKVVAAWNGQAVGALARAARVLRWAEGGAGGAVAARFPSDGVAPDEYLRAAKRVAGFVRRELREEATGQLRRSYCRGPGAVKGFSSDYAYLVAGLIDLAEAGGGVEWLGWAVQLQDKMDQLFWDDKRGGYYDAAEGSDPALAGMRTKEDYDGAEPAPSSVAAGNLVRLAALVPGPGGGGREDEYLARADKTLAGVAGRLTGRAAVVAPQMCCSAWLRARAPLRQVIVAGAPDDPATSALLSAAAFGWPNDRAVIALDPGSAVDAAFWRDNNPRALEMVQAHWSKQQQDEGQQAPFVPTAFVCQDYTCKAPTSDPARLLATLREAAEPAPAGGTGAVLKPFAWPAPAAHKGE